MKRPLIYTLAFLVFLSFNLQTSNAAEVIELKIKDHKFDPEIVKVPAGKKIKLKVLEDILFQLPDKKITHVKLDKVKVNEKLSNISEDEDLRRYIL